MHAHFLPAEYRTALARKDPALGRLPNCSTQALFEVMDRFDIAAAVVSLSPPGVFHGDTGQAQELARAVNEHAAALRRAHPARLAALGVLPLPDVRSSLDEIGHALDKLELDGLELFTNVAGIYLGDPAWEPVLGALDARRAYVFVHPVSPPHLPPLPHLPDWLCEFPFESTRVIVNLVYRGALERFPNVRFHFAHLGGAAPFLAHRIASLAVRNPELASEAPAGAIAYLRRLFLDTAQADNAPALRATLALVPADHVIFGTDWPYAALPDEGQDPAPGLDVVGASQREQIESVNASALVPGLSAAVSRGRGGSGRRPSVAAGARLAGGA
jgi:predicted TIM-barrel fold metal-dependent hydrolase